MSPDVHCCPLMYSLQVHSLLDQVASARTARTAQVRHYWDSSANEGAGGMFIAFGQARLQYGFEYDGRPIDAPEATMTASVPNLLQV